MGSGESAMFVWDKKYHGPEKDVRLSPTTWGGGEEEGTVPKSSMEVENK